MELRGVDETELSGADCIVIDKGGQNTLDVLEACSQDGITAKLSSDYEVT